MPGELSLSKLLSTLKLKINPKIFVFITLPYDSQKLNTIPIDKLQMTFREDEGLTLIVELSVAESYGFGSGDYTFPSRQLTCEVHSSLEAVGFMAAMTKILAENKIGCNPISAYYHDHLYISAEQAEDAVKILEDLARQHGSQ